MITVIDASRLTTTQKPTGVELYCENIIKGLIEIVETRQCLVFTEQTRLILYTPKPIPDLPLENQKILYWPFKKLWSQIRLGLELLIHPPDIFFSPGYVIPFLGFFNKKTKKIVTIHDVAFMHIAESYSIFQRWFLKLTTHQAVKYAHKILTPTQATKNDLIKYFNCSTEKIEVTYFGHQQQSAISNQQSTIRKKQILYLGRIESKKNISNLIKAFELFNKKHSNYKLILAGKSGYGFKNIKYQISNVRCLGYVSEQKKQQLLQESSCLVLISKYEGFGFPLLDGFNYQIPVLASDIPVLREVGNNACLFVNPNSIKDIANGLEKITQDNDLKKELINKGKLRLKDFSWQKCIEQTYKILTE